MRKTVFLYILKELLHIFVIGLMIFTIILLMDKIFKLIEMIVNRGVDPSQILMLLLFISPSFLIFTIPMAVLLAILLTFGRLSGDNEITAFKASGISLYQLSFPVLCFSLAAYVLTTFLVFYGLPWGNRGFKATLFLIAQSKVNIDIRERVFDDAFEGLVVYIDKVPLQGDKMEGVLIYDEREKDRNNTIFAREGYLFSNPASQEVVLRLLQGDLHRFEPRTQVYQKIRFETYDLKLELAKTFESVGKKLKEHEMSIDEIKEKIHEMRQQGKDTTSQEVEVHQRYAIPFACIVFALIGLPLGIQPRRSGRSYGFVFSILILLAYYISLSASQLLAVQKTIPVFLAGWAPNLLFGLFGTYLLVKAAKESPFMPSIWLNEAMESIRKRWRGFFGDV